MAERVLFINMKEMQGEARIERMRVHEPQLKGKGVDFPCLLLITTSAYFCR